MPLLYAKEGAVVTSLGAERAAIARKRMVTLFKRRCGLESCHSKACWLWLYGIDWRMSEQGK